MRVKVVCVFRERERDEKCVQREGRSVCSDRGFVERLREGVCVERERDVEIECVQNDRNVFMSRDRERERERECREIERVCV